MIALCTGKPHVRQDGERIMLSIPSGKDELEIALSFSQATWLAEHMIREVRYAITTNNAAPCADIVALKPKSRRRKGAN